MKSRSRDQEIRLSGGPPTTSEDLLHDYIDRHLANNMPFAVGHTSTVVSQLVLSTRLLLSA